MLAKIRINAETTTIRYYVIVCNQTIIIASESCAERENDDIHTKTQQGYATMANKNDPKGKLSENIGNNTEL